MKHTTLNALSFLRTSSSRQGLASYFDGDDDGQYTPFQPLITARRAIFVQKPCQQYEEAGGLSEYGMFSSMQTKYENIHRLKGP